VTRGPTTEDAIALLQATLESTRDGIAVFDLDGRVLFYNRKYLEMFGFTPADIERGRDAVYAAVQPQLENAEETVAKTRALWEKPDRAVLDVIRFKDGRVYERFVAPHCIGARVVGLVASFTDISQWARTEQALEQHRAFLEKAQEVAHIGSWVAELDSSGRLGWSTETHRIFGVPLGQFAGTADAFLSFVHRDDLPLVRAAGEAALSGTTPYDLEYRIVRHDGTIRWVHAQGDVVRDADGRPLRMIGTVQDITERRQLEDQLRQAQKMEAIGRLAGGVAHDLNNALTAIAGYTELALGQMSADHAARPDVEEIRRAAERAASVTRQLLAFSRKQLLAPRVFNLNDTVAAIARLLARLLGFDVEVVSRLDPSVPPIAGDPGQIEQAILNLAVNARDAMPGGGRLTLETSVEHAGETMARRHVSMPPGTYVVLRVIDTGHGMSPETKSRIFEPFFTTKEAGKGTGLGLSMVYGTVKQVGGFISVESEVGKGTTFALYFPPAARTTDARAQHAAEPDRSGAGAADRRGRETLLIVEDEVAVRNLVASALRNEGYTLLLAASAEEALQIVARHQGPIDLLLTDAIMPGQSGLDLARTLASRCPGVAVILMSGYTEDTLPGADAEQFSLLQKPFTPRALRQRIRDTLAR
jgi:PAS domain S-box-containing protein